MTKESEDKKIFGYFKTCSGYWVTTAPKGWKYKFKDKVWVFNER